MVICLRMGKTNTAKTPPGDFKVITPEIPLLSQQAVTSKRISIPYTNLQLNPYPNTQLDLFCNDNFSFWCMAHNTWLTNYADPNTRLLGLVPLNPIVWYYVCYYVRHYIWLNVVINKVSLLLLSKIMVTWIFGHYHIGHKMHSVWFMWFSYRRYRSQVLCKLIILVRSRWWNWAFHLRRL